MKKPMLVLCISCMAILWKGYDKLVDGFFLYRTTPPPHLTSSTPQLEVESLTEIQQILNQPFYYLASGSQSFVFISKDKRFTLKLFKHYRWKPPFYASLMPHYAHHWRQNRLNGLKATYQSCIFCWEEFREETALVYLQLVPSTEMNQEVTLYNRLGQKSTLDLAESSFVLQKYATSVPEHLLNLKAQGDLSKAEHAIDSLLNNLLQKRYKGFTDKDPNVLNNFGFIGDKAVSIDVGGLIKDPNKNNLYFCNRELKKMSKTLLPWLEKHYPQLLLHTENLIESTKEKLSSNST